MSQSDDNVFSSEASSQPSSQLAEEVGDISLDAKAAKDEALWNDEHTSDDEEFDPSKPEDVTTATAKAEAEDDPSSGRESDEEDDSIVNDEVELACADHQACIDFAKELDAFILRSLPVPKSKDKERRAALVEVLCDHYGRAQ